MCYWGKGFWEVRWPQRVSHGATEKVEGLQGVLRYHRDGEKGVKRVLRYHRHRGRDSGGLQREGKGILRYHGHGVREALRVQRYHRDGV